MSQRTRLLNAFVGVVVTMCWGAGIGVLIGEHRCQSNSLSLRTEVPIRLSAQERKATSLTQRTWPTDIVLHILSKADFERERPDKYTAAWTKWPIRKTDEPCQIFLEEGAVIDFNPSSLWSPIFGSNGQGGLNNEGEDLAHEMLHCFDSDWHPGVGPDPALETALHPRPKETRYTVETNKLFSTGTAFTVSTDYMVAASGFKALEIKSDGRIICYRTKRSQLALLGSYAAIWWAICADRKKKDQ